MLQNTPFHTDAEQMELIHTDTTAFPYQCFFRSLDLCVGKCIPLHWHPDLEIDYIAEGEIEYLSASHSVTAHKGDLVFINTGILHEVRAKGGQCGCQIYAHLFQVEFLGGTYDSLFCQKYILPIMKNTGIQMVKISPDGYAHIRMAEHFLNAVEYNRGETFGYELLIRNELSELWLLLCEELRDYQNPDSEKGNLDTDRLKQMLQYIHTHYKEHLSLGQISAAANISERECTRCFQRCIRLSPISYLNKYRIHLAAQQLLHTSDSILTISENCGFSSSSYFCRLFHRMMGCTPKEYRS